MTTRESCPICNDLYTEQDKKNVYHVSYIPEITTSTCRGCNWAEYLIRNPKVKTKYDMEKRKDLVKQWTLKNLPLIK